MFMYLIKFYDFKRQPIALKVGITGYSMKHRLQGYPPFPRKILAARQFRSPLRCSNFEAKVKRKFAKHGKFNDEPQYRPRHSEWFEWSEDLEKQLLHTIGGT